MYIIIRRHSFEARPVYTTITTRLFVCLSTLQIWWWPTLHINRHLEENSTTPFVKNLLILRSDFFSNPGKYLTLTYQITQSFASPPLELFEASFWSNDVRSLLILRYWTNLSHWTGYNSKDRSECWSSLYANKSRILKILSKGKKDPTK